MQYNSKFAQNYGFCAKTQRKFRYLTKKLLILCAKIERNRHDRIPERQAVRHRTDHGRHRLHGRRLRSKHNAQHV